VRISEEGVMQALGLVRLSKNLNFVAISFTKLSECKKEWDWAIFSI